MTDAAASRAPVARPTRAPTLRDAVGIFLRHRSAQVLVAQAAVAAVIRPWLGAWSWHDLLIVVVVAVVWPLQEWVAHRTILHATLRTIRGRRWEPYVTRYHRRHHEDPWDLRFTFLPTWLSMAMVPLHVGAWFVIEPTTALALTGIAAYGAAAAVYEWTHFLTHVSYKPRRWWYRTLQRRHRLHHFRDEHLWLGFTVPFVDDLFRTAPDPATVPQSATVRTLGVADDPG